MEQLYDLDGNLIPNVQFNFRDIRPYKAGSTIEWDGKRYRLIKAEPLMNGVISLEVVLAED